MSNSSPQDRVLELLADEVVFGLAQSERDELDALLPETSFVDQIGFEQTAAAYYLAAAPIETETLPSNLRATVLDLVSAEPDRIAPESEGPPNEQPDLLVLKTPPPDSSPLRRVLPWIAAAAAGLLIGYLTGAPGSDPPQDLSAARSQLIDSDAAITRVAWTATADPASGEDTAGEVVWSDAKQEGYMSFRGLAANDPSQEQYQLWIFDAERDDRYPVDGGVFDIPPGGGEVITPIRAKIAVNRAVMFAITVEKPGGVVVSDRSRLPLLATVEP